MATALDLIQAGYTSSTANDAGRLAGDTEMLARLDRTFQSYYALWTEAAADGSLSHQTFTFSGVPASVILPTDVIDVDRLEVDGEKANLIPVIEKERLWHLAPAVYRQGLSLISRGQSGDPVAGTIISIWLDDAPATLSSLTSVIDVRFPVRFHNLLVLDLALYLDSKDEGRDPQQHMKLQGQFDHDEAAFKAVAPASNSAKDKASNPKGLT